MTSRVAVDGEGERHSLPSLELEENLVNECVERRAKQSSEVIVTDVTNAVFSCEAEEKGIELKLDEDCVFEEVVLSQETEVHTQQTGKEDAVTSHTDDVMNLENQTARNAKELNEVIIEADEPEQTTNESNVEKANGDVTAQSSELVRSLEGADKKTRNVATQTSDVSGEASKYQVGFHQENFC